MIMREFFETVRSEIEFAVSMAIDVRKYLKEEKEKERLFLTLI